MSMKRFSLKCRSASRWSLVCGSPGRRKKSRQEHDEEYNDRRREDQQRIALQTPKIVGCRKHVAETGRWFLKPDAKKRQSHLGEQECRKHDGRLCNKSR